MIQPETQFTNVGEDRVAYQVLGEGTRDLVFTWGFWSHLDIEWENPVMARFLQRLASFSRLIRFDRRGTGLSDPASADDSSDIERWQKDFCAVLDAAGSNAPIIMSAATLNAGPLILQFIDRYPERCSGLILVNTTACWAEKPDYPQGNSPETLQQLKELWMRTWGRVEFAATFLPSQAKNEDSQRWFAKLQRSMASPRAMVEMMDIVAQIDSRSVLPRIRVPTLVMARSGYRFIPNAQSRYIAEHISGARFVELPGADGFLAWETPDLSLGLIEEFVTGMRRGGELERALASVLFTDIVNSTRRAAELGDAAWRQLLDHHDRIVREQVAMYRGRFIESSGDGTLTTFDSPSHAIDCARSMQAALRPIGIEIRAGLHTGEVELREDGRVGGMAVHIGARLMVLAGAGEVLISRTVHDILIGSRYEFQDRGTHELKGVPGKWSLYAVGTTQARA